MTAYSGMLENLDGLLGPAPRTAAQWVGFARIDWQAAERHHFTLEGIGADWNSPGGGLTQRRGNLWEPQLRLQPGQPAVAARALGSVSHAQPAGRHAGLGGARHPQRAARYALRLRASISQRQRLRPVAADRRGFALRLHHRQSLALRPGQLSRRTALPRRRRWWTGCTTACWSRPASSSTTTPTQPACCATRPAPITTPTWPTSSPTRWPLRNSDSRTRQSPKSAQLRRDRHDFWRVCPATPTTRR